MRSASALAWVGLRSTSTRSPASPGAPSLHAEHQEALGGVVEELPVPLLALDEQRVLALVLQRLQAHLAEHAHEVGDEPDRLLQARVRDDRHAVERLEIRGLVEPQAPRPRRERLAVHVVVLEEELPRVHVGHVLAGHDQREGDVPQAVAAAVGVVLGLVQPLDEPPVDAQVALQAPLQRLRVLPVDSACRCPASPVAMRTLPERSRTASVTSKASERLSQRRWTRSRSIRLGQLIPLAPHRASPSTCAATARPRVAPHALHRLAMVTRDTPVANARGPAGRAAGARQSAAS